MTERRAKTCNKNLIDEATPPKKLKIRNFEHFNNGVGLNIESNSVSLDPVWESSISYSYKPERLKVTEDDQNQLLRLAFQVIM